MVYLAMASTLPTPVPSWTCLESKLETTEWRDYLSAVHNTSGSTINFVPSGSYQWIKTITGSTNTAPPWSASFLPPSGSTVPFSLIGSWPADPSMFTDVPPGQSGVHTVQFTVETGVESWESSSPRGTYLRNRKWYNTDSVALSPQLIPGDYHDIEWPIKILP